MSEIGIGHPKTISGCLGEDISMSSSACVNSTPGRPSRSGIRRFVADGGYYVIIVALVAWNAWWLGRDYWPIPDIRSVGPLIAGGKRQEAEAALRAHLRRSPPDGQARMLLARSLAARGDLLGCASELHRVPSWWPSKREALYLEGESFLSAFRARDAEAAWRACIEDDALHPVQPDHRRAAVENLIKLFAAQERWEEANEIAWSLYESAGPGEKPAALILRIRTEVERIAPETRVQRLRLYVAADPADWQSRRGLARAEQAVGNEQEATQQIQAYLAAHGDDLRAWCDWLEMLHGRGDMTGLAAALNDLPASAQGDGRIWSFRGIVSQAGGLIAAAEQAHRRAASLRPYDEQILYRLALAERQSGRGDQAEAHLVHSKALREARNGLLDALQRFSKAALPGSSQKPEMVDATHHLASLCQTLGLEREARALRSLVPDP